MGNVKKEKEIKEMLIESTEEDLARIYEIICGMLAPSGELRQPGHQTTQQDPTK